ncbi:DUF2316 family protein [Streptomyces sp. RKAG290]|uniref:DUF2316 family protein n=1 Tax=Streptomyces sp. RKAG290 TaxID=2888348 RepID=UPI002033EF50|nr:DUF2316 family protein [Streptomyces sp. RKAG290]MCM2415947.1 DUF2316 family protein [Streptomyces sp. RKAG290]
MSLNTAERLRTSAELKNNLALSGLTLHEVAEDLRFTPERLQSTLEAGTTADPVDVWQLRDYLDQALRDAGGQPASCSALTGRARLKARMWFSLRDAPRHVSRPPDL